MSSHAPEAKQIFLAAVEQCAPDQWRQFVDEATRGDEALRQQVDALLDAHRETNQLLDGTGLLATVAQASLTERPGTQIGPYKLVQEIGEGGMGMVYMAAQKEPVRRKVALKIIKPGMDTREVIARFAAEKQALAIMDHPNIAKVHDAGTTESGRPYFVMELVNGVTITQYCDDNNLWTPTDPGTINIIEPAAEANQLPAGIGSNIFGACDERNAIHIDLYEFQLSGQGELSYRLLDTVADRPRSYTYINDSGAFGYATDNGTTQSVRLYRPDQGSLTVHESPSGTYADVRTRIRINDSNDFLYTLDGIPYLYRESENRSYRLYDLADNYTKNVLFKSSAGDVNPPYSFVSSVVSDDNVSGAPVDDPFDTIGGLGFVLTPVPKQ
jgi:hypothetical protein